MPTLPDGSLTFGTRDLGRFSLGLAGEAFDQDGSENTTLTVAGAAATGPLTVTGVTTATGNMSVTGNIAVTGTVDGVDIAALAATVLALDWKNSVRVYSDAAITIATLPANIDGVAMAAGERFLLGAQVSGAENRIYVYTAAGSAATEAVDFADGDGASQAGVPIEEGDYAGLIARCTNAAGSDVIGTDSLSWGITKLNPKVNVTGSAPLATSDVSEGYVVGSGWVDSATGIQYLCTDNTLNAAVWETRVAGAGTVTDNNVMVFDGTTGALSKEPDATVGFNSQAISGITGMVCDGLITLGETAGGHLRVYAPGGGGNYCDILYDTFTGARTLQLRDQDVDMAWLDQDVTNGSAPVLAVTNMTGSAAGLDSDATAHASSDGTSHTYIDQSVVSGAAPVLAVTNMTGSAAGLDSDATVYASSDGTSHTYIDQDVTNGAAPVLAVTNMTGSAAGLDSDATAHASADGSSHTFIDQSVVSGATPIFGDTTFGVSSKFRAETAGVSGAVVLAELTGAGTHTVTVQAPAALSADRTVTLSDANVDLSWLDQDVSIAASPTFGTTTFGVTSQIRAETVGVGAGLILAESTAGGVNTVTMASPNTLGGDRTITVPDADVNLGYLDQDVTSGSAPSLLGTNITAIPPAGVTGVAVVASGATAMAGDLSMGGYRLSNYGGVGLGYPPLMHSNAGAPTINDDSGLGYAVGDLWYDTVSGSAYIADDVTGGAAGWEHLLYGLLSSGDNRMVVFDGTSGAVTKEPDASVDINGQRVTNYAGAGLGGPPLHHSIAAAPTGNDDSGVGYAVGDFWYDLSGGDPILSVAADVTPTLAAWVPLCYGAGTVTNNNVMVFDGTTGSVIKEPNTDVGFAGQNIANVGNVDGVDVSALGTTVGNMDDLYVEPELVSVGGAHTDTVAVTFKAIDAEGSDEARAIPFNWWLSDSATEGTISGTTPDGGITWTTGNGLVEHTADLIGYAITDTSGDAVISVNHVGGAHDWYLWVEMGGHTITSTKIEITA